MFPCFLSVFFFLLPQWCYIAVFILPGFCLFCWSESGFDHALRWLLLVCSCYFPVSPRLCFLDRGNRVFWETHLLATVLRQHIIFPELKASYGGGGRGKVCGRMKRTNLLCLIVFQDMKQSPQKDLGDPEDSISSLPFPEPYKFIVTCCSETEYLVGSTGY